MRDPVISSISAASPSRDLNQRSLQCYQHQIHQDVEERNNALQDLTSWMDTLKIKKPETEHKHSKATSSEIVSPTVSLPTVCNELFNIGKYAEAVECYSRCLESKEALTSPVIFSNRAMAHLKLKNFLCAEQDATKALQICSTHSKSFHRRSVARLSLGKLRAAMQDVCAAEDCQAHEMKEINVQRRKVENALADAVKRAPRRRVQVAVVKK
jgi:tetratricopeptide (TPR) repeat protein